LARKVRQKLGEILIEWGLVTKEKVDAAYATARGRGQRLGEALVEAGDCKDEDIAKALAHQFGVAFVGSDLHFAQDAGMAHLHDGRGSDGARSADKFHGHGIGRIDQIEQNVLSGLQFAGVFDEKLGQFGVTRVAHVFWT
jgi:hypothetical protein